MTMWDTSIEQAQTLDREDSLARFREEFHFPVKNGKREIYLCGNSLGLQPKRTAQYINNYLSDWATRGVRGHFEGSHPWLPYHEFLNSGLASLTGALPEEVVAMNSLTANLHMMMVSFYRPTKSRYKILIEAGAFPSDFHAVTSQLKFHGIDPKVGLVKINPRSGEELIREEDLFHLIEQEKDSLALVLLPGVQYYTGQVLPLQAIVTKAHYIGAKVGFDLAHAIGNIPLQLHQWNVDFACWCSYKYLNSGAGAVAGCFIHQRHITDTSLPRFAGWWGHDKATRFQMKPEFVPIPTAEGWQLSNPPILSLAAIRASLDVFQEAGGMVPLRTKSEKLTSYLAFLLEQLCGNNVRIITPRDQSQRGCQLSLSVRSNQHTGKQVHQLLENAGVACDWREPDVIRVAPVPLYNSYEDVFQFVHILREGL